MLRIEKSAARHPPNTRRESAGETRRGYAVISLDGAVNRSLAAPEGSTSTTSALIDRPEEDAVGAGEPAICPVPAAIGNAIFDATGSRMHAVLFTPEQVLAAIEAVGSYRIKRLAVG